MRVLVDTSVWVDFFNDYPSDQAEVLARLIEEHADVATCGVVVAELLQGIRSDTMCRRLQTFFLEMAWLSPREPQSYLDSANLYRGLRRQGVTVRSTIDCLIACLASEQGYRVLAKDRDFDQILASPLCGAEAFPVVRTKPD